MKYRNKKTGEVGEYLGYNKRTKYHTIALDGGGQKSATDSTFKRWWVQEDEAQVPASSKNKQKKKGTKKMASKKKMTWEELQKEFIDYNEKYFRKYLALPEGDESAEDEFLSTVWEKLEATIVFSQDSFSKELSEEERSYMVRSSNPIFMPWDTSNKLEGHISDKLVRLDTKIKSGKWVVEYAYTN